MPNNQLGGQISPMISRLTRLRYLNLSMNSLHGEIPETISSCSHLEIVDLYSNSLEGEIPTGLAQCSSLKQIILSSNNIEGSIPSQFSSLANLSALFINSNKLTGTIPQLLGSTKRLTWVSLRNNSLRGGIPPALFHSTSLSYIDLSYNYLSGSIPSIPQISSPLEYLMLTQNNLSGEIPTSIGNLSSLSMLLIAQNKLQGRIPESISKIAKLQRLDLSYNNLAGIVPAALYTISSLTYLGLGANKFGGQLPTNIGNALPNIKKLILEGNQFEGPIPPSLANASNLQVLNLRSNSFSGVIPSLGSLSMLSYLDLGANRLMAGDWSFLSSLTNCTLLQKLWLDRNILQGIMPTSVTNLSKTLEVLILIDNQLSGSIPLELGKLTSLTVLEMDMNFFSGHIPETLGNLRNLSILGLSRNNLSTSLASCKSLVRLNLSSNNFNGSIPAELFSILTLSEALDLSYNQITGHIPLEIGRLNNLNSLNISNNQLSGEIPSSIGQCLVLESLHLEANVLQGSIPGSLINLRGINMMDLSQNNISGTIPQFFTSLSSLQILNISFNDLEGQIPEGGIFANSSIVFIQGNNKLCASSPMLQVPLCATSPSKRKTGYTVTVVVPLATIVLVTLACVAAIARAKRSQEKRLLNQPFKQFKNFSYEDLFKATGGFPSTSLVGSGGLGFVYRGQILSEPYTIAIKVFRLDQFGAPKNFRAECDALRSIRHRNLIRVISSCSTIDTKGDEFKALILEYMDNGNLDSWLHPKGYNHSPKTALSLGSRITIAVDIAAALEYLHNQCTPPLVHCDLKPSNVLLNDEMVACLSDFGLAKFLYSDSSTTFSDSSSIVGPRGSVGYIAPEYGMGCKISVESDVYSYGVILLEMITGKHPTDEMFKDSMNLHKFVEAALPQKIGDVCDPRLNTYDEFQGENHEMVQEQHFVIQLAQVGLKCSEASPKDRPTMETVYAELVTTKEKYQCSHLTK